MPLTSAAFEYPLGSGIFLTLPPTTGVKGYVLLPGDEGNNVNTLDSVETSITGDIDIRIHLALDVWVSGGTQPLVYKWPKNGPFSYSLAVRATGTLNWFWSADGSVAMEKSSVLLIPATEGVAKWLRVIHDVDNGAGGNDVMFYTSDDGIEWTQLGTTQTTAGVTSIFDNTARVAIGTNDNSDGSQKAIGKIFYAEIRKGQDGPIVASMNPKNVDAGATTFQSEHGQIWSVSDGASIVQEDREQIVSGYRLTLAGNKTLDIPANMDVLTDRGYIQPEELLEKSCYIVTEKLGAIFEFAPHSSYQPKSKLNLTQTNKYLVTNVEAAPIGAARVYLEQVEGLLKTQATPAEPLTCVCALLQDESCGVKYILPIEFVN